MTRTLPRVGAFLRFRRGGDPLVDPADRPLVLGGLVAVAGLLFLFTFLLGTAALDVWSGMIVFLVLMAGTVPLFSWVAKTEGDPWLFKVLYGGLVVKLLSSLVRYFVIFVIYGGNGDAGVYHEAGTEFARRFAAGIPIHPLPVISAFPRESQWIGDITGVLYTITSPSAYAGFFFFSFLCYTGQVLMVRALKVAVPEADYRRYALLVLFLPSLLFWPSSIGKEAVMIFSLGLVIYGGALLLAPRPKPRGLAFFALGMVALAYIRPHIAYMSVGALVVATAVGVIGGFRTDGAKGSSTRGRIIRIVALVVLLGAASVASTLVGARFGGDDGGTGVAQSALVTTRAQTSQGGSEFDPVAISTPAQLPFGIISVLYRPFPWEAGSVNALIAATEGLVLLGLTVASWRRLVVFPVLALRRPYLVFVAAYVLVFAVGFSYIANFGILARQRTQMLPMVLVLLAVPMSLPRRDAKPRPFGKIDPSSDPEPVATMEDRMLEPTAAEPAGPGAST